MFVVKILSVCMVVLCCFDQAVSNVCSWTQFRMGSVNEDSIRLLLDMGGHPPSQCLGRSKVFPEGLYKNVGSKDVTAVALQTFGHVAQIFGPSQNLSSVSWDLDNVRRFRNLISRQVEKLTTCVGHAGASSVEGGVVSATSASLSAYFDSLSVILREKKYSACAWEIVREEVRYNLCAVQEFPRRQRRAVDKHERCRDI